MCFSEFRTRLMSSGRFGAYPSAQNQVGGVGGSGNILDKTTTAVGNNTSEENPDNDMGNVLYNFSFPVGFGLLSLTCLILVVFLCIRGPRLRRIFRSASARRRSDRDKLREKLKNKLLKRFKAHVNANPKSKGFIETINLQATYDVTCPICLDMFHGPPSHTAVCLLAKCGHFYHFRCVWTWLDKHSRCPVCRRTVVLNDSDIKLVPLEKILVQGTYLELEGGIKSVSMMKGPLQEGVKRIRMPKAKPRIPTLFARSRATNMSTSRSELIASVEGVNTSMYEEEDEENGVSGIDHPGVVSDGDSSSDEFDNERITSVETITDPESLASSTAFSVFEPYVGPDGSNMRELPEAVEVAEEALPSSSSASTLSEAGVNFNPPAELPNQHFEPCSFSSGVRKSVEVTVERELGSVFSDSEVEQIRLSGEMDAETDAGTSSTLSRNLGTCSQSTTLPAVTCPPDAPSSVSVVVRQNGSNTPHQDAFPSVISVQIAENSGESTLNQTRDNSGRNLNYLYDNLRETEVPVEDAAVSWHL